MAKTKNFIMLVELPECQHWHKYLEKLPCFTNILVTGGGKYAVFSCSDYRFLCRMAQISIVNGGPVNNTIPYGNRKIRIEYQGPFARPYGS
jgi:hypothetical protein